MAKRMPVLAVTDEEAELLRQPGPLRDLLPSAYRIVRVPEAAGSLESRMRDYRRRWEQLYGKG